MYIDCHVHCRKWSSFEGRGDRSYMFPDGLIAAMDAAGIDKAVVMGRMHPECAFCYVPPDEVLDICAGYPDRLFPLMNLDPRMLTHTPAADFGPMLAHYKDLGCKGVGEYVANLPFDDPLQMNVFAHVQEAGLPLTFHIGPTLGGCYGCYDELGLPRLEKVLAAFPDLTFIGHSQPFWAEISADVTEETRGGYPTGPVTPGRVVDLMRSYPNLYGDLSAGSGQNALSRDPEFGLAFLEEFQDRLMFGTDLVFKNQELPQMPYFARLADESLIPSEAFEKITWRNADRVFRLGLAD